VQLLELLLRDVDLFERRGDLVERQVAAFLPVGNQTTQFIQFMNRCAISKQNLVVDLSTLPWVGSRHIHTTSCSPTCPAVQARSIECE
jgi:hypothetical protein